MRRIQIAFLLCCLAFTPYLLHAQAAPPPAQGSEVPPSRVYGRLLGMFEKEFTDLAEAMPEEKYSFAPSQGEFKGVRTFGDQIKHVAEENYYFFGPAAGVANPPETLKALKSKAEILKALKDSFVVAHKAIDSMTEQNAFMLEGKSTRAGNAAFGLAHVMDHYGQMVEYARMNGVVPPASK